MFTNEEKESILAIEKGRRNSEAYFSTKEGDNFFDNFKDQRIRVVGLRPQPKQNGINAHNIVLFSDGHQMSTSRFFAARGISWPVGGNTAKATYIMQALDGGVALELSPDKVTLGTPYLTRDSKRNEREEDRLADCRQKTTEWKTTWKDGNPSVDENGNMVVPAGYTAQQTPTYHFKPTVFPSITEKAEE